MIRVLENLIYRLRNFTKFDIVYEIGRASIVMQCERIQYLAQGK